MMNTLPLNFLGLEDKYCDYKKSRYAVLPVCYDATCSFLRGTSRGPLAIIEASREVELFDTNLGRELHLPGISTLDPIDPDARGPEQMLEAVFSHAKKIIRDKKFLITLGGEHSISSAIVKAVQTRHKKFSVLHIDAHMDMRDTWQGSKFSHACVIRRIHELGINTVSIGIRNISKEEFKYAKRNKHPYITAEDIRESNNVDWITQAVQQLDEKVYITIDIDGFDPACAPGVGTPEPGGLDWYHVDKLLRTVSQNKHIIAADIVETMPIPGQAVTEFLSAKLAARVIAVTQ